MDTQTASSAAILGVVEGVTEFLPVSSTGHLIVASRLLAFESPEFEIVIQLGAMLALTWCYRAALVRLLLAAPSSRSARLFLAKLGVAFVPAALVGLLLHHWIEQHLFRPETVATSLIVGGVLILLIDGPGRGASGRDKRGGASGEQRGGAGGHDGAGEQAGSSLDELEHMSFSQAIAIGLGQTLSLFPGVSRSGATIVTGLLAGLERRAATEFSFFLALPTMYAACLFTLWKSRHALLGQLGVVTSVGLLAAFVSALIVIRAFLRFVQSHTLGPFGWYRVLAGAAVLAWLLWLT